MKKIINVIFEPRVLIWFFIRIQIEGAEASEKAATVGKVYFNILRLECGEPKYPRVCVETEPKDNLKEKVNENSGLIC